MIKARNDGCFGYPSVFNKKSKVCQSCSAMKECKMIVTAVRNKIGNTLTVDEILEIQRTTKDSTDLIVNEKTKNMVFTKMMDKKGKVVRLKVKNERSKPLIKFIKENNINILYGLSSDTNPCKYHREHRYLSDACDLILKGSFTKKELSSYLQEKREWTVTTANSYTLILIHALHELSVIRKLGSKHFELNKDVVCPA